MADQGGRPEEHVADPGTFRPVDEDVSSSDPLAWPRYAETLRRAGERAHAGEAVVSGPATVAGRDVELALFDFSFMGGSMGEAAGERLVRAMERAARREVPFVLRTATGGARMQEGMVSLAQMPKVVAAREDLADAGVPCVAALGNPTTGGVLASVAALADVTIAEEEATLGFAGPRIVHRVTGTAPQGESHTAETALAHGLVDAVAPATEWRGLLGRVLALLRADEPEDVPPPEPFERRSLDAWDVVQRTRREGRYEVTQLVDDAFGEGFALRGDRSGAAGAVLARIVRTRGRRAMVVATPPDRHLRPDDYRLARRAVEVAARLRLPVVTLVDTRGADPSEASENAGIAWEIARTFEAVLTAPVPVLAIVTGEGASGGALALAAGDRMLVYEEAFFSVIAPELAAEILWRDPGRAPEAAEALRPTAPDLVELGIADDVLPGAPSAGSLAAAVPYHLALLAQEKHGPGPRRRRWRRIGQGGQKGS